MNLSLFACKLLHTKTAFLPLHHHHQHPPDTFTYMIYTYTYARTRSTRKKKKKKHEHRLTQWKRRKLRSSKTQSLSVSKTHNKLWNFICFSDNKTHKKNFFNNIR